MAAGRTTVAAPEYSLRGLERLFGPPTPRSAGKRGAPHARHRPRRRVGHRRLLGHQQCLSRRLYASLFPAAKGAGFHTLVAGIALPNEPSIALHEAMGFTHVGTFHEVGRKFDQWWDVGYWELSLAAV